MTQYDYPPLGDNTIASLWPFQREAVDAVFSEWERGRTWTLVFCATGTGKTRIGSNVARRVCDEGGNVVVLSHRKELVNNFGAWLDRAGIPTGIEMAGMFARSVFDPRAVSASVPTLQGERLDSWEPGYFTVAIIDEVHHMPADAHKRAIDHLRPKCVLGLTATPRRGDGDSLANYFDSVAFQYSMLEALRAPSPGPYLCRPIYHYVPLPIDIGKMRKGLRDYTDDHLQRRILPHVGVVANAIRQTYEGRPTVAFLPGVMASQGVATALRSLGVPADWLSGEREDRADVYAAHDRGDIKVIVNCDVTTEGVDIPWTSCVVLGRPTTNPSILVQQIGRGSRRHDRSGKQDFLVVDLAMQTGDPFDLMAFPTDIFDAPGVDPAAMELARSSVRERVARGEQGIDLAEAVEAAAETVRVQAHEWRVKAERRDVITGKTVKLDPVGVRDILAMPKAPANAMALPATSAQVGALEKWGLEGCGGVSKRLASSMLSKLRERKEKGLASPRQLGALIRSGMKPREAREMSFADASARLDRLFGGR